MKSKALNSLKAAQRLVEARETYGTTHPYIVPIMLCYNT